MANIKGRWFVKPVAGIALLALGLSGCAAGASEEAADDARPTVLATFTVIADMARVVAGDAVNVESLTDTGTEIHTYEPTPDDLVRAGDAELVLNNGLGLESWFARFTEQSGAPSVTLTDGVPTIPIESGDYEGEANPHAWMSPDNARIYVANIRDALSGLAPEHAEDFAANAEEYQGAIEDIGAGTRDSLHAVESGQRALVTCEGAFSYLARDADLQERYLWPVNAESEATPRQIAEVVDYVDDNDVPAVFCESTVDDGPQRQVAAETGARLGGVLYVDSLSDPDGPVPTYLDLLRYNTETIVEALTGDAEPAS